MKGLFHGWPRDQERGQTRSPHFLSGYQYVTEHRLVTDPVGEQEENNPRSRSFPCERPIGTHVARQAEFGE